jgi:hypothetical protein
MGQMGFDVVLAVALIFFALWEGVISIKEKSRKRALLVVGSLALAAILLYLRAPEWLPLVGR